MEPEDSPILSGGAPGPHKIQGIGPGFVPDVLETDNLDGVVKVSNDAAVAMARRGSRVSHGPLRSAAPAPAARRAPGRAR